MCVVVVAVVGAMVFFHSPVSTLIADTPMSSGGVTMSGRLQGYGYWSGSDQVL